MYYTAKEAADILNMNYHTLLSRARKGTFPCERIGWAVLFRKDDIDAAARDMAKSAR